VQTEFATVGRDTSADNAVHGSFGKSAGPITDGAGDTVGAGEATEAGGATEAGDAIEAGGATAAGDATAIGDDAGDANAIKLARIH
jgi:hypothetical protein